MEKQNWVGVDVSAKTFTFIIDQQGVRSEPCDLSNDPKGHKKLIRLVTRRGTAKGNRHSGWPLGSRQMARISVMRANGFPRALPIVPRAPRSPLDAT